MKQSEVNRLSRFYERQLKTPELQGKAQKTIGYLHRGVISGKNIVSNENGLETFKHVKSKTGEILSFSICFSAVRDALGVWI